MRKMIKVRNLNYKYKKDKFELKNINLDINKGYITVLVGNNGCGKTTLMRNIYGSLLPNNGEVLLDDEKIGYANLAEYHKKVSFVGKDIFAGYYTIVDNVNLLKTLYDKFDEQMFYDLIKELDLANRIDSKYSILSRGQKMKAEIAFALSIKPEFIILDEPFAGLDEISKQDIIEVLQVIISEENIGVFVSTHILDEIEDIADYVIFMKDGEIVKSGDRDSVIKVGNTLTDEIIEVIGEEE